MGVKLGNGPREADPNLPSFAKKRRLAGSANPPANAPWPRVRLSRALARLGIGHPGF